FALLEHTDAKRKMDLVDGFLEKKLNVLWAMELSRYGPLGKPAEEVKRMRCYYCSEEGHTVARCKALSQTKCYECHKLGHTKKFCKQPQTPRRSDAKCWRKQVAIIEKPATPR